MRGVWRQVVVSQHGLHSPRYTSFGLPHLERQFSWGKIRQGRQILSFMRCLMTTLACSYFPFKIIRNGRAHCHKSVSVSIMNPVWKVMVSATSSSSGLKLHIFLCKKGSGLCVCFKKLRARAFRGWFSNRNLGKNNKSK